MLNSPGGDTHRHGERQAEVGGQPPHQDDLAQRRLGDTPRYAATTFASERTISGGPWAMISPSAIATMRSDSPIRMDAEEHDQFGWFTFPEAYEKIRWTDDREALEKLESHVQRGQPVSS